MPENKAVVIVTVSGGFIGGAVCRAFVSDDYSVVGFDRPDVLEPQPGVTNTSCDVTEEDRVAQAVSSVLRDFAEPLASLSFIWLRTTTSQARAPLRIHVFGSMGGSGERGKAVGTGG